MNIDVTSIPAITGNDCPECGEVLVADAVGPVYCLNADEREVSKGRKGDVITCGAGCCKAQA
jgi:hypothetical protein